jgi:hypothetical protein
MHLPLEEDSVTYPVVTSVGTTNLRHAGQAGILQEVTTDCQWAGIAQSVIDSLQTGWCGDRIPVGKRLSAPVQTDPGADRTTYTMGTGSFPGLKGARRGVDHPSPYGAEVKETVEL